MFLFVLLALWQFIKAFKPEQFEKMEYFKVMFNGLREKKWSRIFFLVFLARRILF
jgi:hypothetical protein